MRDAIEKQTNKTWNTIVYDRIAKVVFFSQPDSERVNEVKWN